MPQNTLSTHKIHFGFHSLIKTAWEIYRLGWGGVEIHILAFLCFSFLLILENSLGLDETPCRYSEFSFWNLWLAHEVSKSVCFDSLCTNGHAASYLLWKWLLSHCFLHGTPSSLTSTTLVAHTHHCHDGLSMGSRTFCSPICALWIASVQMSFHESRWKGD